jgi:hypothetical protein
VGWELAVIAATLLGFSVVSRRLAGTSITSAIIFVGVGLLAGSQAPISDALDSRVREGSRRQHSHRAFSDVSRIDLRTLRAGVHRPGRLLGIGLLLMIVLARSWRTPSSSRSRSPRLL